MAIAQAHRCINVLKGRLPRVDHLQRLHEHGHLQAIGNEALDVLAENGTLADVHREALQRCHRLLGGPLRPGDLHHRTDEGVEEVQPTEAPLALASLRHLPANLRHPQAGGVAREEH